MTSPNSHADAGPLVGFEARRERQRSDAKRAILAAAEALLVEMGGTEFSMRELGRRCGYSAPTVYHYFGDKDGLIEALLEQRLTRLAGRLDEIPRGSDPGSELRDLFVTFAEFGAIHATFNQLMRRVSAGSESVAPVLERMHERVRAPILELAAAGRLGDLDDQSAGQILWALLHGLLWLPVMEPDVPWVPDLAGRAFSTLLRGMSASPETL